MAILLFSYVLPFILLLEYNYFTILGFVSAVQQTGSIYIDIYPSLLTLHPPIPPLGYHRARAEPPVLRLYHLLHIIRPLPFIQRKTRLITITIYYYTLGEEARGKKLVICFFIKFLKIRHNNRISSSNTWCLNWFLKWKIYLKLFSWDFIIIQKFCLIRNLLHITLLKI